MAKKATAAKAKKKAKAPKDGVKITVKAKSKGKAKDSKKGNANVDALARLAEHPIVSDLIAVGASAAVAAIAQGISSKSGKTNSRAVKDAGKAAATAIGLRLVQEFKAVRDSAAEAADKRD
ncbi:MAG: hypothetical protein ABI412_00460 [Sphingomicrobium sp.]